MPLPRSPFSVIALASLLSVSLLCCADAVARLRDGFFAYCTSNLDGTGDCVNQEDGRSMDCIVVPGQIIECQSTSAASFQCVWISAVAANQAQFWCDPSAESLLYGDGTGGDPGQGYEKVPSSSPSGSPGVPGADADVLDGGF